MLYSNKLGLAIEANLKCGSSSMGKIYQKDIELFDYEYVSLK